MKDKPAIEFVLHDRVERGEIVDYQPVYNEEALDRFAAEGAEAWAGVPDALEWVRKLRGG